MIWKNYGMKKKLWQGGIAAGARCQRSNLEAVSFAKSQIILFLSLYPEGHSSACSCADSWSTVDHSILNTSATDSSDRCENNNTGCNVEHLHGLEMEKTGPRGFCSNQGCIGMKLFLFCSYGYCG